MNVLVSRAFGESGDLTGVRPERLRLVAASALGGNVTRVEPVGADTFVTVATAFGPVVVRVDARDRPANGSTVGLAWDPRDLRHFDASGIAR
jgi:multiple sugar transport system ATP-binding protein